MSEQQTVLPIRRATVDVPLGLDLPAEQAAKPASKPLEAAKWVISFPAMLAMFLIGRVFYEGRGFVLDPDVWWHIKVGQDILRTHLFPTIDSYSFTAAGTPWIAYEWLGEIVLALVHRAGGVVAMGIS